MGNQRIQLDVVSRKEDYKIKIEEKEKKLKKIISFAMVFLVLLPMFSVLTSQVRAEPTLDIEAYIEYNKEVWKGRYSRWDIGDSAHLITATVTSGGRPMSGASVTAEVTGPSGEQYWLRDGSQMLYDTVQGKGIDQSGEWKLGPVYGGVEDDGIYANFLELRDQWFANHAGTWRITLTALKEGYAPASIELTLDVERPTGNFGHRFNFIDLDTSTPEEDWVIYASPGETLNAKLVYDETNPCPACCVFYIRAWGCPYEEWGEHYNIDHGCTGWRSNVVRSWTYTVPSIPGVYTLTLNEQFAYWWPFYGEHVYFVGKMIVGAPPPVDWHGIMERAVERKRIYEIYRDMFSSSWWKKAGDGLVKPVADLYKPLENVEDRFLDLLKAALEKVFGEIPMKAASTIGGAGDMTKALLGTFLIFKAIEYHQISAVLGEVSKKYNIASILSTLIENVDSVISAAEDRTSELLMSSLEQEKQTTENLYQGTVTFEAELWQILIGKIPAPFQWSNAHQYGLLVRYPYYDSLDHRFRLEIENGHLVGLRAALEANYLDITNGLGDLSYLDEVVNAPLTERPAAPLVKDGYWTVNGNKVNTVDADTELVANVLLTTYDSMKASGQVTAEVWKDFWPWGDEFHKAETKPNVNLEPGETTVISFSFIAEYPQRAIGGIIPRKSFKGYYLKVRFSGGLGGLFSVDDLWVTWDPFDGREMEDHYPPRLKVRPSKLRFKAESPVNLLVITPDGLRVGYDPDTDSVINEIVGWATYSGLGTEPQIISILNPIQGVYTIDVLGTDAGDYTITMEFLAADGSVVGTETYTGDIVEGAVYVYVVSITDEGMTAWPYEDDPPITTLTIGEPKYVAATIYVMPRTPFKLEATDGAGSGVRSTFYRIRNTTYDSGWLLYDTPFNLTSLGDGVYTIEYHSIDNIGNVEDVNTVQVTLHSLLYAVDVTINPEEATIEPGLTVEYTVIVENLGFLSDSYDLSLEGLDPAWFSLSQTSVALDSGETAQLTLTVSLSYASMVIGDYPFEIEATSQTYSFISSIGQANLEVTYSPVVPDLPEGGLAIAIKPKFIDWESIVDVYEEIIVIYEVEVLIVNNENYDDVIDLDITTDGFPPLYQADLEWMSWTSLRVFVPAHSNLTVTLRITVPMWEYEYEEMPPVALFKVLANSETWTQGYAQDYAIIFI